MTMTYQPASQPASLSARELTTHKIKRIVLARGAGGKSVGYPE